MSAPNKNYGKKKPHILITQPKPESAKSPYWELAKRHHAELTFFPFILLQPIHASEFRKQKVDITHFSSVMLTSKNAIDHFFRMSKEMKININPDLKYFCINESVALYLQKFILYRKRKIFFGIDGTNKSLFDVLLKHKETDKFLYVCSENQQDNEIVNWLKDNGCEYKLGFMYRSLSNDVKELMTTKKFDIICFFTPSGVRSLFHNFPGFIQNGVLIGAFGNNTIKAVEDAGLKPNIKAPAHNAPSMIAALEQYLLTLDKEK